VRHQQDALQAVLGEPPPLAAVTPPTAASEPASAPVPGGESEHDGSASPSAIDRRRAFAYLAGVAGVGAATVLSTAAPAAAVDGQAILAGGVESSQSITGLVATASFAGPVLHVRKTNAAFDLYSSAVQGSTGNSAEIGVIGLGTAVSTTGVTGFSLGTNGVGVQGEASGSGGRGGVFDGPQAAIQLNPQGTPPPRSNNQRGDIVMDGQDSLWVCVGTSPSRWRLLGGPSSAGALTMLSSPTAATTPARASRPSRSPRAS